MYAAPRGGLLAGLAGSKSGLALKIGGKGSWRRWDGALLAERDGARLAALRLTNLSGRYGALGLVWPGDLLTGLAARAAGGSVALAASGTLKNSVFQGNANLIGEGLALRGSGAADLGENRFDAMRYDALVRDPERLFPGARLDGAQLNGTLDGPFRDLTIEHRLTATLLTIDQVRIEQLTQEGRANLRDGALILPLDAAAQRVVTGDASLDSRLAAPSAKGTLTIAGNNLSSDDLLLAVPGITARLALRGDMAREGYGLAGQVAARGLALTDLGTADADGRIVLKFGKLPWTLDARLAGRMVRVDNATLTSLAGTGIRFGGDISLGAKRPLLFQQATLSGSKLSLGVAGR